MMCLNSMIAMLVQDESSQAFWIETVNHEFSVQRASDTAKAFLLSRKDRRQEPQESGKEDLVLEVASMRFCFSASFVSMHLRRYH